MDVHLERLRAASVGFQFCPAFLVPLKLYSTAAAATTGHVEAELVSQSVSKDPHPNLNAELPLQLRIVSVNIP